MSIYQVAPEAGILFDVTGGGVASSGTYLLTIVNRGADAVVSVALTAGAAVNDASWIEWEASMKQGDVLSRWPLPLLAGARIHVKASTANISVTLAGREE